VYVQKLFERDGTSFSAYVLEHRLAHVHRRLRNPRFARRSISRLVYDAGFNNLSWFNRAFRRRYGATPSEIRAGR
jgi:AraC-like DNA-binding protein